MSAIAVFGIALVLGAPAPKEPPAKAGPSIVGEWALVTFEPEGMSVSGGGKTWEFSADGKLRTHNSSPEGLTIEAEYAADPAKNPAELDLGRPGRAFPGIYKVEKDGTFVICYAPDAEAKRPTKFESTVGAGTVLITLKRLETKKD